ncbi:MAG: hypothetical protein NVSMB23_04150 [Myxococcales bacterium]
MHTLLGMSRLFLSGQTTCALLLGAGLLLRAQAALRFDTEPAVAPQQAAKSAFEQQTTQQAGRAPAPDGHAAFRGPRPMVGVRALRSDVEQGAARGRAEHGVTHSRKARAQGRRVAQQRRCGAPLATGAKQGLAPQGKRCN